MPTPCDLFYRPTEVEEPQPVPLKPLTVRFPPLTWRYLEEMAEHADLSRNAMALQLIEWGIAYAMDNLPEELRDPIGYAVEGEDYYRNKAERN